MTNNAKAERKCSRGHRYQGGGPCPICYPGYYKKTHRLNS